MCNPEESESPQREPLCEHAQQVDAGLVPNDMRGCKHRQHVLEKLWISVQPILQEK
jgi:hypothetical protein